MVCVCIHKLVRTTQIVRVAVAKDEVLSGCVKTVASSSSAHIEADVTSHCTDHGKSRYVRTKPFPTPVFRQCRTAFVDVLPKLVLNLVVQSFDDPNIWVRVPRPFNAANHRIDDR